MMKLIALPAGYQYADVLAFHGRDPEGVAEQVSPGCIRKGVLIDGVAVVLTLTLGSGEVQVTVQADAALTAKAQRQIDDAILNMLGLRIDPAPFLRALANDPTMGEMEPMAALAARQPGLRIVQSATIFEALTWAIIGQQINLPFAIALRRSFIMQAGRRHSSGLWCYPEAGDVARLDLSDLTTRKFSRAKAETLLRLAALVDSGALTLARDESAQAVGARLLAVKGIGPWTVNYALLRGYGYPDCSLHGDVAVRTALGRLLGEDPKPGIARAEMLLARYQPYRSMAAAHLWASLHRRDQESA